mmetsp:Transcript_14129/g.26502  ORF Transcript_14129/g.26502 Transcript_14129/m.26502 type:complete len:134 (-) Transcript_14129:145-546(-)
MLYHEASTCATAPNLTGIPPHIPLLDRIAVLTAAVEASTESLAQTIRTELDRRSVGGPVFAANNFIEGIRELQQQLTETLQATRQLQVGPGQSDTMSHNDTSTVAVPDPHDSRHHICIIGEVDYTTLQKILES